MTGRERMLMALRFEEPDRPPHFEAMFELEKEAFGLSFPDRRSWQDCTAHQKRDKIEQCMEIYCRIVERYQWDALAVYWPWSDPEGVAAAKRTFGDSILIGGMAGHGVCSIETITDWEQFALDLMEAPEKLHEENRHRTQHVCRTVDQMIDAGADFIYMPNDVADNRGPFISPPHFRALIAPYLAEQIAHVKRRGAYAFLHSDGMLMPVLKDIIRMGPDVLQSIDPMAGMDIAAVKRATHGHLALMGNVQCNLMQEGPPELIERSARYCLEHGSRGGGYIFSTSNTIFPGMPLAHYEHMLQALHTHQRQPASQRARCR